MTPEQKRAIVNALQRDGHTVAMTGDGVNDALALKDADLGIAMGNGAGATKAVARLVLLDGRFDSLPGVVAQGRRVMANMERVANLFLTKTTYAAILAVAVVCLGWPYPFFPRHLTLVGAADHRHPGLHPGAAAQPPALRRRLPAPRADLRDPVRGSWPGSGSSASTRRCTSPATRARPAAGPRWCSSPSRSGSWACSRGPGSWWRGSLVTAMVLLAAGVFLAPAVRSFLALELPDRRTGILVLVVGSVGCLLVETVHRVRSARMDAVTGGGTRRRALDVRPGPAPARQEDLVTRPRARAVVGGSRAEALLTDTSSRSPREHT